ncbi:hypothetical protein [Pseudomonas gingeri]
MSAIATTLRNTLKEKLWQQCDDLGWMSLPDTERARHYEMWTRDASIGGQLAHIMDARKVRVYIKDSLVKPYVRDRLSLNESEVCRILGLDSTEFVDTIYIKPHGRRLVDGRVIGWGRSRDWKSILMTTFERGQAQASFSSYGIVLLESGKTESERTRNLIKEAAERLGIQKLVWM